MFSEGVFQMLPTILEKFHAMTEDQSQLNIYKWKTKMTAKIRPKITSLNLQKISLYWSPVVERKIKFFFFYMAYYTHTSK